MLQVSREALLSTPGRYTMLLVLVAVSVAGWSVYDARRRSNERAAAVGAGLLLALLLVYAPGTYLVAESYDTGLALWVGTVLVATALISFGAGYWVYADATERGTENPPWVWGIMVGASLATGTVLGLLLLLVYVSNRG